MKVITTSTPEYATHRLHHQKEQKEHCVEQQTQVPQQELVAVLNKMFASSACGSNVTKLIPCYNGHAPSQNLQHQQRLQQERLLKQQKRGQSHLNQQLPAPRQRQQQTMQQQRQLGLPQLGQQDQNALLHLESAIEVIPLSSREAYTEARMKNPSVIELESNPIYFIKYDEYNVWSASCRLVMYWEWRKKLFGKDRFFKTLFDLTGTNGAMTSEFISILERGAFVMLPSLDVTCSAASHRSAARKTTKKHVFFTNRARLNGDTIPFDSSLSLPFYFFTWCLSEGIVDPVHHSFQVVDLFEFIPKQKVGMSMREMIKEAFPVHLEPILLTVPYTRKRTYFKELLPKVLKRVGEQFWRDAIQVEIGDSKLDIQRKLEARGFSKENLPERVGGTWSYDNFDVWLRNQKQRNVPGDSNQIKSPDGIIYQPASMVKCPTTTESLIPSIARAFAVETSASCNGSTTSQSMMESSCLHSVFRECAALLGEKGIEAANDPSQHSRMGKNVCRLPEGSPNVLGASQLSMASAFAYSAAADLSHLSRLASLQAAAMNNNVRIVVPRNLVGTFESLPRKVSVNNTESEATFGSNESFANTNSIQLLQVIEAMKTLSWMENSVFIEATERCCSIIKHESNPQLFIDYQIRMDGNRNIHHSIEHATMVTVARQLASYWKKRKELFNEKAFDCIHGLSDCKRSAVCAIRRHASRSTSKDDIMLFLDMSQLIYQTRSDQERCLFYNLTNCLLHICSNQANDDCSVPKIDLMLVFTDTNKREFQENVLSDLRCCFPIEFTTIHVVLRTISSDISTLTLAIRTLLPMIVGRLSNEIHFHIGTMGSSDVVNSLLQWLDITVIPVVLGGAWNIHEDDRRSPIQQPDKSITMLPTQLNTSKRPRTEVSKIRKDDDGCLGAFGRQSETPSSACVNNTFHCDHSKNAINSISCDYMLAKISRRDDFESSEPTHSKNVSELSSTNAIWNTSLQHAHKLCRDTYSSYIQKMRGEDPIEKRGY